MSYKQRQVEQENCCRNLKGAEDVDEEGVLSRQVGQHEVLGRQVALLAPTLTNFLLKRQKLKIEYFWLFSNTGSRAPSSFPIFLATIALSCQHWCHLNNPNKVRGTKWSYQPRAVSEAVVHILCWIEALLMWSVTKVVFKRPALKPTGYQ